MSAGLRSKASILLDTLAEDPLLISSGDDENEEERDAGIAADVAYARPFVDTTLLVACLKGFMFQVVYGKPPYHLSRQVIYVVCTQEPAQIKAATGKKKPKAKAKSTPKSSGATQAKRAKGQGTAEPSNKPAEIPETETDVGPAGPSHPQKEKAVIFARRPRPLHPPAVWKFDSLKASYERSLASIRSSYTRCC